jgi:hypothetical protein
MTEANSESWKKDGQKDDLRIEELLPLCVFEDAAGFALEETFEAAPLGTFLFPIIMVIDGRSVIGLDRIA